MTCSDKLFGFFWPHCVQDSLGEYSIVLLPCSPVSDIMFQLLCSRTIVMELKFKDDYIWINWMYFNTFKFSFLTVFWKTNWFSLPSLTILDIWTFHMNFVLALFDDIFWTICRILGCCSILYCSHAREFNLLSLSFSLTLFLNVILQCCIP
jgi:hypothetical protein